MNIVDELRAQANQHPLDVDLIMFDVAATKIDELEQQCGELAYKVIDLETEIEDRDKRTDIDYHRSGAIRELLYLCDEEIAQLPVVGSFGIEHLARAVNRLKQRELPDYKKQRDELLAALKDASEIISDIHNDPEVLNAYKVHYDGDDILRAKAAIKNAEGEQ